MTLVDLVAPVANPKGAASARAVSMSSRHHRSLAQRVGASAPPSLAVVDPSTLLRTGLPMVLTGFTVTGSFATAEALLAIRPRAEIVLLDLSGDGCFDEGVVRSLSRAGYRVCLFTFERRHAVIARFLAAGARGVVSKADSIDALAAALARIAAGGTAIGPEFSAPRATSVLPELTQRQLQILAGRARGETFHSIARRLEISERTAQDHWSAIARRFEYFLRNHSAADLERSLGLDNGVAPLELDGARPHRRL